MHCCVVGGVSGQGHVNIMVDWGHTVRYAQKEEKTGFFSSLTMVLPPFCKGCRCQMFPARLKWRRQQEGICAFVDGEILLDRQFSLRKRG